MRLGYLCLCTVFVLLLLKSNSIFGFLYFPVCCLFEFKKHPIYILVHNFILVYKTCISLRSTNTYIYPCYIFTTFSSKKQYVKLQETEEKDVLNNAKNMLFYFFWARAYVLDVIGCEALSNILNSQYIERNYPLHTVLQSPTLFYGCVYID